MLGERVSTTVGVPLVPPLGMAIASRFSGSRIKGLKLSWIWSCRGMPPGQQGTTKSQQWLRYELL